MFAPTASFPTASAPLASTSIVPSVSVPIEVGESACFGLTTAGDVIRGALLEILVQGADAPLSADEYADGIDILNDYMSSLEGDGIRLGYQRVCNVSDVVTVPDAALRGIKSNLAIELAPQFNGSVSQSLILKAQRGLKTIRRIVKTPSVTRYPGNLPVGSGNFDTFGTTHFQTYYGREVSAHLSMVGNRKTTPVYMPAVVEKVQGTWRVDSQLGLDCDISGRVFNRGDSVTLSVDAAFTLSGSVADGLVGFAKNGAISLYAETVITDNTEVVLRGDITLETGDSLIVVVGDKTTTEDVRVVNARVRLN